MTWIIPHWDSLPESLWALLVYFWESSWLLPTPSFSFLSENSWSHNRMCSLHILNHVCRDPSSCLHSWLTIITFSGMRAESSWTDSWALLRNFISKALWEMTAVPKGKRYSGSQVTQAMISSVIGGISLEVTLWYTPRTFLQEEWLNCQRNWLYLESIFNAPDIQRQLPAEAKMFLQVDKSWKEIMRKVNRLPNALRAATQPGTNFQTNHVCHF